MENFFSLKMDEVNVYSLSGKAYPRRTCRDRSELNDLRLPFVKRVHAKGRWYTYFKGPADLERIRIPNDDDPAFAHAYLSHLGRMEGQVLPPYRAPKRSRVYFIQTEGGGAIKIGVAQNVHRRIDFMQTGNHERLVLRATIKGGFKEEREYHARFSAHRLHGEWFAPHPDILAEIDRLNTRAGMRRQTHPALAHPINGGSNGY